MKLTIELDDGLVEALAYLANAEFGFDQEDNPAEQFVEDAINERLWDLLGVPVPCDRNGKILADGELTHLFLGDEAAHAIVPLKEGDNAYPIYMSKDRIIELYEAYQDAKKKAAKVQTRKSNIKIAEVSV